MFLALILIVIGLAFLLKAAGLIAEDVWAFIWPSILIALGLALLFKRRRPPFWWGIGNWHSFGKSFQRRFKEEE